MNSCWVGDLNLKRKPGTTNTFTTAGRLSYLSEQYQIAVTVKCGFMTDGASSPKALWWFVAPFAGIHASAALIHDALYASHLTTKEVADNIFIEALQKSGVGWFKRHAMYQAVNCFGDGSWKKLLPAIKSAKEFVMVRELV